MRTQRFVTPVALLAVVFILGACGKAPINEEKAAEDAIDAARPLAEIYAPAELEAAVQVFDQGKIEIEAQVMKSEYARSYSKARDFMIEAKSAAERAGQAAEQAQEQARLEAESKLTGLETGLEETKAALDGVRKLRRTRTARRELGAELDGMTASIEGARDMLDVDTYLDVVQIADELQQKLDEINTRIGEL